MTSNDVVSCLVCFKVGLNISQVHTLALQFLPVGYQSAKTDH